MESSQEIHKYKFNYSCHMKSNPSKFLHNEEIHNF